MAKGAKKGGRIRDKWRDKQWVVVNSPSAFASGPLNYIPITSVESCKGRVIENTMFDILRQDPTQHQTKVFVQIESVHEGVANTIFKGHEYAKEFLRSLVRRGSSMISHTHDYTTSDGYTFRVMMIAFTQKRINSSKMHEIRMLAYKVLSQKIPQLTIDQFVQEVTMGKMGADLLSETRKVASLRHIGIRKTKLISTPRSKAIEGAKAFESMEISPELEDPDNNQETQGDRSARSTDE
jgi:small subunit ribosomal protein S3Ae